MPIDTSPEGAELLHPPVVKPFPEFSPKEPHHAHYVGGDGHNHEGEGDDDAGTLPGISIGPAHKPGTGAPPPG
jgi:hypothetical protein